MTHEDVTRVSQNLYVRKEEALTTFGHYRDLKFLGQGGMARVYSAHDDRLGRSVALKLMRGDDPELRIRLQTEARVQASIDHPGICKIYEIGEVDSEPYIAMQLIHGRSLMDASAEMVLEQKLDLMREVSLSVHAAHRSGLIHRDLKPANILVEKGEEGKWVSYVVDFGLAREAQAPGMTATGLIIGSPGYMSPEQARGEIKNLDRRSDVYSLGVTAYELLTGKLPFESEGTVELLLKVVNEEPLSLRLRDSSLPEDIETIVMKCLEKDPSRRYESAKALAEDIERYLAGDPIRARPAGIFYRAGKKIRKNKALVATVATAFVISLVFGGITIRERILARKQAVLASQLGQEVKEMESTFRFAQMLPLHDIAAEKQMVRRQIARIENRIQGMDSPANAPGNYAIGRGYLALQDYARARKHLEAAWQGYRDPRVASALGLVMGTLYQKDLQEADLIVNKEQREARRRTSEKNFRDPALEYLKAGESIQDEWTEYVQGLIAFYEKDYGRALQKASEAGSRIPWFFEAQQLAGEIHQARGKAAGAESRYDEAVQHFDLAEAEFRKKTQIARSDARAYLGLCSVQLNRAEAAIYGRPEGIEAFVRQGLELCKLALTADSESVDARLTQSRLYVRWGEYEGTIGKDPRALLQQALFLIDQAIKIQPDSYVGYQNMGIAYRLCARYENDHGLDATSSLNSAIAAHVKSIAINPAHAHAYSSLGNAYTMRGQIEWARGLSPLKSIDSAIESFRKAIEIDPKLAIAFNNLGVTYNNKTNYELTVGVDPGPSAAESIRAFSRSLELKPNDPLVYSNMGNPYLFLGQYAAMHGKDPEKPYLSAIEAYSKSVEINPNLATAVSNLGLSYKQRGMHRRDTTGNPRDDLKQSIEYTARACELSQEPFICSEAAMANYEYGLYRLLVSEDPLPEITAGTAWARKALELHEESSDAFAALSSVKLLEARRRIARKQDAMPALLEAERAAANATRITPAYIPYYISEAMVYRFKAEYELQKRKSPAESCRKGLDTISAAMKVTTNYPELHALQGAFLAIKRAAGDSDSGPLARSALEKAIRENPTLEREYIAYLRQLN